MRKIVIASAVVCMLWLSAVGSLFAQNVKESHAIDSFQLYYGGRNDMVTSVLDEIQAHQLVVVDRRSLSETQFERLKKKTEQAQATLIGYISIGELHSREMDLFKAFVESQDPKLDFEKLKSEVFISDNTVFSSHHVDVAHPMWRAFILSKAAKLHATGVDGFFLDTVDTVDLYALKEDWDADHRCKSVTAMISLIRAIKEKNSNTFTLQNRGLNIIGDQVFIADSGGKVTPGLSLAKPHEYNPDVILFENAFNATNTWADQVVKNLDAIQKSGEVTVVALGYEDIIKDKEKFLRQCDDYKFVPSWASNSESLHLEVAR